MALVSGSPTVDDVTGRCRELEKQRGIFTNIDEPDPKKLQSIPDEDDEGCMSQTECNLSESPEEKALRIPTVLDIIAKHLTFEDTKKFRLMNSVWDDVISVHMLKNDISIIKFEYDSKLSKYIFDSKFRRDPSHEQKMLTDLLRILRGSKRFPCASFSFLEGDLTEPEIDLFFTLQGQKIKTLCYHRLEEDSFSGWLSQATVTDILTKKAPNIECLEMEDFYEMDWDESNQLVLPSLKILDCYDSISLCVDTAFAMVAAASQLEKVYNFDIAYIDWFLSHNKVHTIKKYTFWIPGLTYIHIFDLYMDCLVKFVHAKPQLEHLIIPYTRHFVSLDLYNKKRFSNILNLLLESSKNSLRTLEVVSFTVLPGIRLPKLDRLDILKFHCSEDFDCSDLEQTQIFPPELMLEEAFPNVKSVSFVLTMDQVEAFFPPDCFKGRLPEGKCLELSCYDPLSDVVLVELHRMMPNVTKIILCAGEVDLTKELKNIGNKFPDLEEIELRYPHVVWDPCLLDPVITGIPEDVCENLVVSLPGPITFDPDSKEVAEIIKLKENWTICDLQNLKRLKICFDNKNFRECWFSKIQVPSHISGYALQKRPDLEVIIAYHQHCASSAVFATALQSIAPFVKLVHEDCTFEHF